MLNPHLRLIYLLQEKEQASLTSVNTVKDQLKFVADHLLQQSPEQHLEAAFVYYVAGYYVRASRLISRADISDQIHPALRWVAQLLSKKLDLLEEQTAVVIVSEDYHDSTIANLISQHLLSDLDVIDRIFTHRLAVILQNFLSFIINGDKGIPKEVQSEIRKCQRLAYKSFEYRWWWLYECFRLIICELVENSLWTQLGAMLQENVAAPIITRYIVNNCSRKQPVVELWRTQTESLSRINDPLRRSFCISIPTSGGKTRIAELMVLRFLLDYRDDASAKCIYIAPFRKLANEVEEAFSTAFAGLDGNLGTISSFYGWNEIDVLEQSEVLSTRILIVTPEKLDGLVRQTPEILSQIRLVIADEGHLIGDNTDRGYKYRMLLERLICKMRIRQTSDEPSKCRLLFVSGVLPNVEEFAELITGDRSKIVKVPWRPLDEPIIGVLKWNGSILVSENPLIDDPRLFASPYCNDSLTFEGALAKVSLFYAQNKRTLVFSASKQAIKQDSLHELVQCLDSYRPIIQKNDPLPHALPKRDDFYRYYALLERGIGIHHADLPRELRFITEDRIDKGKIWLLFASPTLAQGVNVPFDVVLVYRLQHSRNIPIQDASFWNVVGRVGRPASTYHENSNQLTPPQVIFIQNGTTSAAWEDKYDIKISKEIVKNRNQYRVASPFLQFLNELRTLWQNITGRTVAELVNNLAEKASLDGVATSKITKTEQQKWTHLLTMLDEHLVALCEESGLNGNEEEWLQEVSTTLIDLFVKATVIQDVDLEFIKDIVLARASYIAHKIPRSQRRQDYVLGLPTSDCELIRRRQAELLSWYMGCEDIFTRNLESGIENLVQLVRFVTGFSIVRNKEWNLNLKPLIPLFVDDFFRSWLAGEDQLTVSSKFNLLYSDTDFEDYRETMFEQSIIWGLSALGRFLQDLAQSKGLNPTKDLDYLPALVKYGVSGTLACHLVRLKLSREAASAIAGWHIRKVNLFSDDPFMYLGLPNELPLLAQYVVYSLTEVDLVSLNLDEAAIQRIKEIAAKYEKFLQRNIDNPI